MAAHAFGPYTSVARKWLALAERRQAHFVELSDSGRWKHYFTPVELDLEIRRAAALRDQWARLAGIPTDDEEVEE
jgi:hypothetical protein